ncbi:hypothetical protein ABPG77_010033 [Micractinium sp. CCAP 211/92]
MGCGGSKSVGQTLGFKAVGDPKSRCTLMMKEATLLQTNIKLVVKEVKVFQATADKTLDGIKQLLATPLPKIYETDDAAAEALLHPTVATIAGENFSAEAAVKAKEAFTNSAAPRQMETWLVKYEEAMFKQKLLNKSFDELHHARNKVASARGKEESLRRGGAAGEDPKLVEAMRVVQLMQDKLNIATENYRVEEEAQYTRLVNLINEASTIGPSIRERLGEMANALASVRDAVPSEGGAPMAASAPVSPSSAAGAAVAAAREAVQASQVASTQVSSPPASSPPAAATPVASTPVASTPVASSPTIASAMAAAKESVLAAHPAEARETVIATPSKRTA